MLDEALNELSESFAVWLLFVLPAFVVFACIFGLVTYIVERKKP